MNKRWPLCCIQALYAAPRFYYILRSSTELLILISDRLLIEAEPINKRLDQSKHWLGRFLRIVTVVLELLRRLVLEVEIRVTLRPLFGSHLADTL